MVCNVRVDIVMAHKSEEDKNTHIASTSSIGSELCAVLSRIEGRLESLRSHAGEAIGGISTDICALSGSLLCLNRVTRPLIW